jgi:hypothetical protein
MLKTALLIPLAFLSACATIVNGGSQTVTVSTTPPGATCTVDRMGARIGAIPQTPGSLRLDKSKNDLSVTCNKPGFQTAAVTHSSSFGAMTAGNVLGGLVIGPIGFIVDAASGANYEYPSDIRLDLAADAASGSPPFALQQPSFDRGARYASDPVTAPARQRTLDPVTAHTAS